MKYDVYLEIMPSGKKEFKKVKVKRMRLRNPLKKTEPLDVGVLE